MDAGAHTAPFCAAIIDLRDGLWLIDSPPVDIMGGDDPTANAALLRDPVSQLDAGSAADRTTEHAVPLERDAGEWARHLREPDAGSRATGSRAQDMKPARES